MAKFGGSFVTEQSTLGQTHPAICLLGHHPEATTMEQSLGSELEEKKLSVLSGPLTISPKSCPKRFLPATQWVCSLQGKSVIQGLSDPLGLGL